MTGFVTFGWKAKSPEQDGGRRILDAALPPYAVMVAGAMREAPGVYRPRCSRSTLSGRCTGRWMSVERLHALESGELMARSDELIAAAARSRPYPCPA